MLKEIVIPFIIILVLFLVIDLPVILYFNKAKLRRNRTYLKFPLFTFLSVTFNISHYFKPNK